MNILDRKKPRRLIKSAGLLIRAACTSAAAATSTATATTAAVPTPTTAAGVHRFRGIGHSKTDVDVDDLLQCIHLALILEVVDLLGQSSSAR